MSLQFKRIEEEKLLPSMENIDKIRMPELRKEVAGEQGAQVKTLIQQFMLETAISGRGIDLTGLPDPIRQKGLACQTCALLNGIQAVAGKEKIGNLPERIEELRDRAIGASGTFSLDGSLGDSSSERYSMDAVAQVLISDNLLTGRYSALGDNPTITVDNLFKEKRFFGVSDNSSFHAYCLVPFSNPTYDEFVLKIDSLGGIQTPISSDIFLNLLLNKNINDHFAIYLVS